MENVQLWLLEEMSSASLSGAGGLDSESDFPPQTFPSSHPQTPPLGFRSRKTAKGTVASVSQPWFGGGRGTELKAGYTSSLLHPCLPQKVNKPEKLDLKKPGRETGLRVVSQEKGDQESVPKGWWSGGQKTQKKKKTISSTQGPKNDHNDIEN